ncbi:hypothetical protein JXB28_04885 [Candidatus Woesearchaeota archaeon]|nr:hypothetical protein [Candidatus Woesearchaeota archaeon]
MTDLVACLGTGKGTWTGVLKLVSRQDFEQCFLIVNSWTKQSLQLKKDNLHLVVIDSEAKTASIKEEIIKQLEGKIKGFEVAVNLDSGAGKEHTAVVTALIQLGFALRFVEMDGDDMIEVSQNQRFEGE